MKKNVLKRTKDMMSICSMITATVLVCLKIISGSNWVALIIGVLTLVFGGHVANKWKGNNEMD